MKEEVKIVEFNNGSFGIKRVVDWGDWLCEIDYLSNSGTNWVSSLNREEVKKICQFHSKEYTEDLFNNYLSRVKTEKENKEKLVWETSEK